MTMISNELEDLRVLLLDIVVLHVVKVLKLARNIWI